MAPSAASPRPSAPKKKPVTAAKAAGGAKPRARSKSKSTRGKAPQAIPRAMSVIEDDDAIMSTGAGLGAGFGRCGGRILVSQLEQTLCDRLSGVGIAHSHSPRHFEVRMDETRVAAYAPMVVLRGRGREGKTVVIEGMEQLEEGLQAKIIAFREQYGAEFYVTFVAPEEVFDDLSVRTYDESCTLANVHTLISRLAE